LMGGWGLRNFPFFYRELSANTFSRVLMKLNLWSKVIKAKYFPHLPVHIWMRSSSERPTSGSQTWKHLSKSLPIILQWISWNPSNGYLIEVGRDSLLGLGRHAMLSPPLLVHLHSKSLFFLHQFSSSSSGGQLGEHWLSGMDLQLESVLKVEWDGFIQFLSYAGIRLQERLDTLMWTWGDCSISLIAKNVNQALVEKFWSPINVSWCQKIWKGDCPIKLKLFTWLLIENKLLVWEKLQSCGWEGPSRCILCKQHSKTIPHIFYMCSFTRSVRRLLTPTLKVTST
jgi:hypothetical protein